MSDSEPELQVPSGSTWACPQIDVEWHDDWDAFSAYMDDYQAATHQIFRQRTSTSVQKRNQEIAAAKARSCDSGATAGDGEDAEIREKEIRKSYFEKSTGCKVNLKAAVAWNDTNNAFMVHITGFDVRHKHSVSKAVYENHVSNRRVENPNILAFVDELQAAGSKPKRFMQYLRKKTGKKVALRDVHNMVARMREKRRGGATAEEHLEMVLRGIIECRGNRATVYVDDDKTAQTITLQTRQMRRLFKAFAEVLLVDATCHTNDSRYKLFSLMVNDVYEHGQYVQHSLMENESAECLSDAISSFKFNKPSWDQVKVIKYIRTEMAKSEYGGPTSFDKDQVEDAVDMLRLATSLD
ncbi:hypothetical protein JG688_00016316 [Phytophthora aleatoria]|uniref:ZSWIM1/3 RNaseH-like domain-containing protein n=1 Tax=Phytophthora aleatoria TaxID=2496075 RepID=A0A8J5MCX7_9STRA|nr:hypothetical protein JG688_00016316 [Phytophthora aleatoria]